jgi:hypothetical protein
MVLQWCYKYIETVLRRCCKGATTMLQECYKDVTRCNKYVTRVLHLELNVHLARQQGVGRSTRHRPQRRRDVEPRDSKTEECSKGVTKVLQGRCKGATRMLQGCYKGATRVLQGCYKRGTRVT